MGDERNEIKLDQKDMDRLKKHKDGGASNANAKPSIPPSTLALRGIAIAIAVVYYLLLIFGKNFLPEDGEVMQGLNVFSGAENPSMLWRVIGLSILTLSISALLRYFIGRMTKNKALTKRTGVAIIELLGNLVKYVTFLVLVFLILGALGVNTTELLAGLGIIGLIVGLGVTSLIEDIVAGIFIIAERLFDVGDIVVVDGFRGTVEQIGIRSTQFKDVGGDILIMRNSSIGSLVNLTRYGSGAAITIPLDPKESLRHVEEVINNAHIESIAEKYSQVIEGGPYYLGPCDINVKGVKSLLFVAGCQEGVKYDAQRILYKELINLFQDNNITIGAPNMLDEA